ncbi:hypothetical protein E5288_WYG020509 [Bos mutus]|uniref:Uncharacterized protein n=1 Tax=Bos mutus TaxID=72004 RepID=A0A6B0S2G1_9CETA|nr:hypothetical protein [Bos mutus]
MQQEKQGANTRVLALATKPRDMQQEKQQANTRVLALATTCTVGKQELPGNAPILFCRKTSSRYPSPLRAYREISVSERNAFHGSPFRSAEKTQNVLTRGGDGVSPRGRIKSGRCEQP